MRSRSCAPTRASSISNCATAARFLGGDAPGLLDIHAWTVPWFARPWMPVVNELLADFPRLSAWERALPSSARECGAKADYLRRCVRSGA